MKYGGGLKELIVLRKVLFVLSLFVNIYSNVFSDLVKYCNC